MINIINGVNVKVDGDKVTPLLYDIVWGTEFIQFPAAWQNGCFRKMDDHLGHITPTKPLLSQNGCSYKNFSSNHPCC